MVSVRAFLLACLVMVSFSGCLGDQTPEAQASIVDTFLADDEVDEAEPTPIVEQDPEPVPVEETEPAAEPEGVAASEEPTVVRAPRFSFTLGELFLPRATASGSAQGNPLDALANAPYRFGGSAQEEAAAEASGSAPVLLPEAAASAKFQLDVSLPVLVACHYCTDATGALGSAGFLAGENGVDSVWVELPPEAAGRSYNVASGSPLNDPDGEFLASCTPTAGVVRTAYSGGPERGVVPAGAGCFVLWEYMGPGFAIHIVIA